MLGQMSWKVVASAILCAGALPAAFSQNVAWSMSSGP
jgi:hypothetical protein